MSKWTLIAVLFDEDGDVFETAEYGFDTYFECMGFRSHLQIEMTEDPEIASFKLTVVRA